MLFNSPPRYCAGVRTLGKIRETTRFFNSAFSMAMDSAAAGGPKVAAGRRDGPRRRTGRQTFLGWVLPRPCILTEPPSAEKFAGVSRRHAWGARRHFTASVSTGRADRGDNGV